jgi:putative ABC transport system permease protein
MSWQAGVDLRFVLREGVVFSEFVFNLKYALRQLRRSPSFALIVILTLALSVGVATAVFCVIDAVILRPLPFANQDQIVAVQSKSVSGYNQPASWPSYQDERKQASAFSALAAYWDYDKMTLETPDKSVVSLASVGGTDNFFQIFGVAPLLGRTFLPGEEEAGKNDVVVLSYEVWQAQFSGDRGVVNRVVRMNDKPYLVIGVMPAGFRFPLHLRNAVYTPLHIDQKWMENRGAHWLRTVGRVKDGLTVQQAQADLQHVFSNLGNTYTQDKGRTVVLERLASNINAKSQGPLWTLLGAVLAVLAIGCVNVAGLLLSRGVKREREMAMRVAVGAGRGRLLAQMLTEGVLLAVLGAAGGVLLAVGMLRAMRVFLMSALARGADIHLDWRVLGAAVAAAMLTSLAATLYPALRLSGVDPNRSLKTGGSAGTERHQHRLRSVFVVTQVALTLVLLFVAGLLLRVVSRYRHAELGFSPDHILSVPINLSRVRYASRDIIGDFYRPLEERVQHLPGVEAAGLINVLPIESWGNNSDIHIAGQPPYPPNQEMLAEGRFVSEGYFDVMGLKLHGGRKLAAGLDLAQNSYGTVLVNDAFVKKFIPKGLDPTAQRIDDAAKQEDWTRIVGVVSDVRQNIYEQPLAERDWLMDEIVVKSRADTFANMTLLVRTKGDPKMVIPEVRSIIHDLDPTAPFAKPRTMNEVVSETLIFERMESWLFGIFAGLALVLALVGLYGLVSNEVEQSRRDIGVRMALGATRGLILSGVLRRVAAMLCVGAVVGLVLTIAVRKLVGVVIYFEPQKEAGSTLLLAAGLLLAGLIASIVPAIRAASTEPVKALRTE